MADILNNKNLSPLARVLEVVALERSDIRLLLVLITGVGLLNLAIPVAVQALINTVTMGGLLKPLAVISIMLLMFLVLAGTLYLLEMYVVEMIQRRLLVRTALDAAVKAQSAEISVYDQTNMAEVMNRFFSVISVQKSAATLLTTGVSSLLHGIIGSLILIFYSVYFGIVVALIFLILVVIVFVIGRRAEPTAIDESQAKYELAAWLEIIASNLNTFKFSAGLDLARRRIDALASNFIDKRREHFRILVSQYIGGILLYALGGTSMLALGGMLVIQGNINLGQFVAAEIIIFTVLASFLRLIGQLEYFYDLLASVDKLGVLQDLPQERRGSGTISVDRPIGLAVHDLSYDYLSSTIRQSGISFQVPPGGRLAILGSSGSGKSNLAELLTGLRQPASGRIEYNGIDLRLLDLQEIRRYIGFVGVNETFEDSVLENVRVGRSDITVEQVSRLLGQLGLLDAIARLDQGLDSKLAASGAPLSSSETRLLMLARALISRPALLILDSLLDPLGDEDRKRAFEVISQHADCTLVMFTRIPEIAEHCDQVLHLTAQTSHHAS
jgi:putative ABC transport system ATP-binding protein